MWTIYVLIGACAGLLGGLLGIGGGSFTVPVLFFLFSLQQFSEAGSLHMAIGTSLAAMTLNTLVAFYFHAKKEAVAWSLWRDLALGLLIGSLLGVIVAERLPSSVLRKVFGVFACLLSLHLVRPLLPEGTMVIKKSTLQIVGGVIAFLANLLGIGGGIFTVPLLTHYGFATRKEIGTSCGISFLVSFLGAMSYLLVGEDALPKGCIGYVYLPAFFLVTIGGLPASIYGALLAHKISSSPLRKLFAAFLLLTGVFMILFSPSSLR